MLKWQKFGADIFELNSKAHLLVVDYCSKYPELCLLKDKTAGQCYNWHEIHVRQARNSI